MRLLLHICCSPCLCVPLEELKKDGIRYFGEVPDAHAFMAKYSVMAVPLLSGSGMRVKIVEAMAAGKTVISTNIGAEGNPAEHGREILLANTETEFAQHIIDALNTEKHCEEIGMRAKNLVLEKFDTFAVAKRLKEFYLARQTIK